MNIYLRHLSIGILVAIAMSACSDQFNDDISSTEPVYEELVANDKFSVKLHNDIVGEIDNKKKTIEVPTGSERLDSYLKRVGATSISRIFPYAGKDECRQCESGLNLWYTVNLTAKVRSVRTVIAKNDANEVYSFAEPVYTPQIEQYKIVPVADKQRPTRNAATDDPFYWRQWDFKNNGDVGNYTDDSGNDVVSSIAGADINIEPAWQITTGSPDVVVAVVDGGIDYSHPDLQQSMWVNTGEIPSNGIDDDNNGFVDDYYGYNFVDDTGNILPTEHGTHVAGTIAARSNNGIGVAGIAGGDGTPESGVRLMSCQIFKPNPDYDPTDPDSPATVGTGDRNLDAAAIVYGANNGAVISQNSWGFSVGTSATPQVVKEAIYYFNKNAGGAHTAHPVMKGGLVVFAAGNDYTDTPTYPASDDNVVSVAASNPDYSASWYTNYGGSVDICAPGGSGPLYGKFPTEDGAPTSAVLSTVPLKTEQKHGYAYMQGTSMACPHVSGIAALIVSHFGGPDFTAAELRQRLLSATKRVNYDDYVEDRYKGKLGLGYVDALEALKDYDMNVSPTKPEFVAEKSSGTYNSVTVGWKSANKGDDGSLQFYRLYSSLSPITKDNYTLADCHLVNANYAAAEQVFEYTDDNAKSNSTYYFAVQAVARNGNASGIEIMNGGVSTLVNLPPVITSSISSCKVTLAGNDKTTVVFHVEDPEGHECSYGLTNAGKLTVTAGDKDISVLIDASKYVPGTYPFTLTIRDQYGARSSVTFVIEIVADRIPSLKKDLASMDVRQGKERTLVLADIIDDEQPDKLSYELRHSDNVDALIEEGKLVLKGKKWGEGWIVIKATDIHQQSATWRVPAFVYSNEGIYALYPTVATTVLYLKVGAMIEGESRMEICDVSGKTVIQQLFDTKILDALKRTLPIDISSIPKGGYTLILTNKGKSFKERFVKG